MVGSVLYFVGRMGKVLTSLRKPDKKKRGNHATPVRVWSGILTGMEWQHVTIFDAGRKMIKVFVGPSLGNYHSQK